MADREKVIQGLEHCGKQMDCDGCPYDADMGECFSLLKADAIELLKDQEPIEPYKPEEVWLCGACDEIVGWEDITIKEDNVYHKYCPNCGRKLKWEWEK